MKKKEIYAYLFPFFNCFSLSLLGIIPAYSFISVIVYLVLVLFYKKVMKDYKSNKYLFVISFIISVILSVGEILYSNYYDISFSLFSIKNIFKILICIIGLLPLFIYSFNYIFSILGKTNINEDKKISIKYWLIFSSIIFICWIPYFLINYPGIVSSDVIDQLNQFLGLRAINDHHPVFHTIYVGGLFKLFSFDSSNFAIACSVIMQMLVLSLIFGYLIYYLNKKGLSKFWTIIMLLFYVTPIFGASAVNLWKDSIFSGFVVLLIISIMKIYDNSKNKSSTLLFIISSLLCLFFRNNAIYMYVFLLIITLIFLRKKRKILVMSSIIVLSIFFVVKGPVYKYYNISKGSSAEYLAIPIQQIARMTSKNIKLNKKEEKLINDIIDISVMKEIYNPYTSDSIKFNNNFNINAYDKNKLKYLKLWSSLVVKHPFIATESYLLSTLGYWYSDVDNYISYGVVASNNLDIYYNPKAPSILIKIFNVLNNKNIPFLCLEYSCSFGIYLVLLSLILCFYKKNKKYLLCYVPIIGLWLSIMIATPVASEFRYIFWSYASLPILLFIPFKKEK